MNAQSWVVTGAAGFLGSHVVERLLQANASVVGIDNLAWGNPAHLKLFSGNPQFQFHKIDIRDTTRLADLLLGLRPAVMVHLAALHFIPAAVADPPLAVSINVHGTQSVLTACRQAGIENFWFASTGDVYQPSDLAYREDSPLGPFNIYGLTKVMGEQLISLEAGMFPNKRFIVGRLFNLYGPRETNPHILPEIISQLRERPQGPLRLGNIWPKRDMVPINEAARAIVECVDRCPVGLTTVNLATGAARSIQEVITTIGDLRGKFVPVETDPDKVRPVERPHLQADVSRLKTLLGWAPSPELHLGLKSLLLDEGLMESES